MFVEDGSELKIELTEVAAPENSRPVATAALLPQNPAAKSQSAPVPAGNSPARKSAKESSVRVPSERLDRLVNLVGELVMNQSRLSQVAALANVQNLAGPVE